MCRSNLTKEHDDVECDLHDRSKLPMYTYILATCDSRPSAAASWFQHLCLLIGDLICNPAIISRSWGSDAVYVWTK
jgi:hypothetical protein